MGDSDATTTRGEQYTVAHRRPVTLGKQYTPNGNRLQVGTPDGTVIATLDAVQLEALTWQERATLLDLLSREPELADTDSVRSFWRSVDDETPQNRERIATITNEYAEVFVQLVDLGGQRCCELVAPKLGFGNRLTPSEFRAVAAAGHQVFSGFLRTPLGPEKRE